MERRLVTVRQIDSISPIPGADSIQVATVEGWKVVIRSGEFNIGDYVLYLEIDSFLPESDPRYTFLMKSGVREFEGVRGHKLRTVKLRGQISQGLVLPLSAFPELVIPEMKEHLVALRDFDFAQSLGIKKYEAPIPAALAGQVKGSFPSFIKKTDQERCISGDTLVDTEKGKITIKELCEMPLADAPKITSFNHNSGEVEFNSMTEQSVMRRGGKWLQITTKMGRRLLLTDNHRVWCDDLQAYRLAAELVIGQQIHVKN